MSNKSRIINIIFNALIVALTIIAILMMFFGDGGALASSKWEAFKYFTVQSNLFAAISSAISLIYLIFKKDKEYPTWLITTKLVTTLGVAITFFVVIVHLGPIYGYALLYAKEQLFLHAIIPLLAMINFTLIESKNKMSFKLTFYSFLPIAIYGSVYMINVACNNDWGNIKGADWYAFGSYGPGIGFVFLISLLAISYLIALGFYLLHQKTKIKFLF